MIKKVYIIVVLAIMLAAGSACQSGNMQEGKEADDTEIKNVTSENMSVKEFWTWCSDEHNRLNKVRNISDMTFKLYYLPSQAMAYLDLRSESYDLEKFKTVSSNFSEMTYFKIRIEAPESSGELLKYKLQSQQQYQERIQYTSFNMQNDLCLVQNGDTLLPGLFQFERVFDVAPYSTAMFAFDNKKFNRNKDFTIVYNDRMFEKGYVKFNYKSKQLINLPNISEL